MKVKYPNVEVTLVGGSGNAFAILGAVTKALRRADVPKAERDKFMEEATKGDYDHLLRTAMEWVEVN